MSEMAMFRQLRSRFRIADNTTGIVRAAQTIIARAWP